MNDQTPRPGDAPGAPEEFLPQSGAAQQPQQPKVFDPAEFGPPQPQPLLGEQPPVPGEPGVPAEPDQNRRFPVEAGLVAGAQLGVLQAGRAEAPHDQGLVDPAVAPHGAAGAAGAAATKSGFLATTTAKIVAGCVALVLLGAGAVTWAALSHFGGSGGDASDARAETGGSAAAAEFEFNPKLTVAESTVTVSTSDAEGLRISLTMGAPKTELTGVDPQIAENFMSTVDNGFLVQAQENLDRFSQLSLSECGGMPIEPGVTRCDRDGEYTLEQAGIYENYGTVATTSGYVLGSRDRNPGVYSVTMDLKTGETAELVDFIDISDAAVQRRAEAALQSTENWPYCTEPVDEFLAASEGFSPSDEGIMLLWPVDGTQTARCGVDRVVIPWVDSADAEPAEQAPADPLARALNGTWCPTPETLSQEGCYTIEFPIVTYPGGSVAELNNIGDMYGDGGIGFTVPGAPFGTYFAAGVAIAIPDYYPGTDIPDAERIWSGQSGMMLLKQ